MSADVDLHSLLHARFHEAFGPPHRELYENEQWSFVPSKGNEAVHVLLNGTPQGPLVWVFNPHDPQNMARHFAVTHNRQIDDLIAQLKGGIIATEPSHVPPRARTAFLEDVLTTAQLAMRPSRPPGYAAENEALVALAQGMASDPQAILQLTVDTALSLCRGHSSGISILEPKDETEIFRWHATAGAFASRVGGAMPRESPCGTVLDRNALLMFERPELHFRFPGVVDPPIEEVILAPFHAGGRPVGTVWVMAHTRDRKFDREDARLLASVAQFAGAAYQVVAALDAAQAGRAEMASACDALAIRGDELEAIVAQRTRELVEANQRLRLSERMAAMGTLSAGLGHDMANMVMAMRMRLDVLRKGAESAHEHVEVLGDCVSYIQSLAGGLRLMAIDPSDKKLGPERFSLAAWWVAAHRVVSSGVMAGPVVESRVPESLPDVLINRAGLTQAVYNLVQNAADALKRVDKRSQKRGRGCIVIAAELDVSGPNVLLSVSDDGPGMTEEVRLHCMDPFFSTKTGPTASGLGLALVHSVIKAAGGAIRIDSEPGRGTTFILTLPVAPGSDATPAGSRRT